jgi:hypothetical protein
MTWHPIFVPARAQRLRYDRRLSGGFRPPLAAAIKAAVPVALARYATASKSGAAETILTLR